MTRVYVIPFYDGKIWGATAGILRNLWERLYERCLAPSEAGSVSSASAIRLPWWNNLGDGSWTYPETEPVD